MRAPAAVTTAVTTAVGIGAALSQTIAGGIVHRLGYHAGFLFLAAVAAVAFVLLWALMPETQAAHKDSISALASHA